MFDCLEAPPLAGREPVPGPPPLQFNLEHRELWESLGLPRQLYDSHLEFAEFLFNTKLLFPIVGYQETMEKSALEGIQDPNGRMAILVQGQWRDFAWIQANLVYDPIQEWICAKGLPEQIYTYVSPRCDKGGLTLQSRHFYTEAFPVHKLDLAELVRLRAHAGASDNEAMYQLFSTPSPSFLSWIFPAHIGARLIMPDGVVYSFGGQPHPNLANFIAPVGSSNYSQFCNGASTGEGVIAMSDYDEFRSFQGGERLVTTFPITAEKAEEMIAILNTYQENGFRFNLLHQNCAKVGVELTEHAIGVRIDNKMTATRILSQLIPEIPLLTVAWHTVKASAEKFWGAFPDYFTAPFEFMATTLFYIPNKMLTFLTNCLVLTLGGAQQSDDFIPPNDNPNNQDVMTQFSRLFRDITDLFQDHPSDIYHHMPVIEWQKRHPKTISYQYDKPKMYILPPLPSTPVNAVLV